MRGGGYAVVPPSCPIAPMTDAPPSPPHPTARRTASDDVPLAEAYRLARLQGRDLRIVQLCLELGWDTREIAAEVGLPAREVEQRIVVLRSLLERHGARWESPRGGRLARALRRRRA